MKGKVLSFTTRKVQTRECHEGTCRDCDHVWAAPAIGACPKCGKSNIKIGKRKHFDYARVR